MAKFHINTQASTTLVAASAGRRRFLAAAGGMAATVCLPGVASAANWPESGKPIRIIAGQAPGSSNDATARALADFMSAELKTTVVVENKPGGIGMIAASNVARSAPDGYTFLITLHSQLAQAPVLLRHPPIDPSKDLIPVGAYDTGVGPVVARKGLPVANFKQLLELAKSRPVTVGNYGIGSGWQIMITQLAKQTGAKFDLVHYKGTGPMVLDLISGNIDIGAGTMAGLGGGIQRGDLKPLLLASGSSDNPLLPGLPTWADEGFVGPAFQNLRECNMVLAPAGTPQEVVRRVADIIDRSAKESERMRRVLDQMGVIETPPTGKALREMIARTWPTFQEMTRELNLVVQ